MQAAAATRLPAGHPEGFLEAFANLYRNFAHTVHAHQTGTEAAPEHLDFPGVQDGLRGMRFLDAVVRSSQSDTKWLALH